MVGNSLSLRTKVTTGFLGASLLLLTSCQQAGKPNTPAALYTPQGMVADALVSKDSMMVIKFGLNDEGQKNNLKRIGELFPQQDQQSLQKQIIDGMNESLQTYGMTFEKDVDPIIGKNPQLLAAFSPSITPNEPEKFDVVLFAQIADTAKFDALMAKVVENGELSKSDYKGNTIYSGDKNHYMARVKDLLIVDDNDVQLQRVLDQATQAPEQIADAVWKKTEYQNSLKKAGNAFAFAHFDVKSLFEFQNKVPGVAEMMQQMNQASLTSDLADLGGSEVIALSAEDKGIRVYGNVQFDAEKIKQLMEKDPEKMKGLLEMTQQSPAYLYKQLPAGGAVAYSETANLKPQLEALGQVWGSIEGTSEGLAEADKALKAVGINFTTDVLPILDKGQAFVFQDNGTLIPALGFYIDASSHPDLANGLIGKFDALKTQFVEQRKKETPEMAPYLVDGTADLGGNTIHSVTFRFGQLIKDQNSKSNPSAAAMVPAAITDLKLEFWYGVAPGNILFMNLYNDFPKIWGTRSLENDENFKATYAMVKNDIQSTFGYASLNSGVVYLDRLMQFVKQQVPFAAASTAEYDNGKLYFAPFKGMIMGAKYVSQNETEIHGYILMGK